ncbi:hypothetical protein IMZ31_21895 (plasmid) [Pontibacillus sp. ALD_SL1]|uniref:hypothetical protein n=1 Tax=Pontibacillus sp. ALD_SL1 TaxID=2777185 RepID=UPI001A978E3D|nr:hypothetical protein [Pontibacillus sp. ALD_SL1]QST02106.1 hypothetical protein IMZ31_21895 [Pontibacillus sp. ALD_SL1]
MHEFQEKHGSLFLMIDGNPKYEIAVPSVLFDRDTFTVLKIGNRSMVQDYYEESIRKCQQNGSDLFESWYLMDLPKDAHVLNRIFHHTGYLERMLEGVDLGALKNLNPD